MAAAIGGGVIQMLVSRHPPWRIPSRPSALPFEVEEAVAEEVEGALRPLKSLRRSALLLFALPALVPAPSAATALSIGIPGPKEWLKEQKKKSAKFVLAPIEASRNTLRSAVDLLNAVNSEEMRRLLNLASRDCVPLQRSSLVQLQSQTGVEVCTFRLIVKNAASLLDKNNPVKLEAEVALDDLIRSFSLLGDVIIDGNFQVEADREKVKDGLVKTISSLDKFEQGIKECLGV
ncbi:uncharacterized protein LOC135614413 isoform X2 [Musa acuminata AAA Group]|uniref:uncharacterized protein LOC135614413 isoform X2 n=1 Tax=Musa acuminata AAA Group TaxID=214697 RepID=UPI0031D6E3AC